MNKTRVLLVAATVTVYIVCPAYRYYAVAAMLLHQLARHKEKSYTIVGRKQS